MIRLKRLHWPHCRSADCGIHSSRQYSEKAGKFCIGQHSVYWDVCRYLTVLVPWHRPQRDHQSDSSILRDHQQGSEGVSGIQVRSPANHSVILILKLHKYVWDTFSPKESILVLCVCLFFSRGELTNISVKTTTLKPPRWQAVSLFEKFN